MQVGLLDVYGALHHGR